jgi:hypothetical protein
MKLCQHERQITSKNCCLVWNEFCDLRRETAAESSYEKRPADVCWPL